MSKNSVPTRMCSGCMTRKPKNELLRIVRSEDKVIIDTGGKSDGRGAYVCPNAECIKKAEKKKGFQRSLKCEVSGDIYQQLTALSDGM